MARIECERGPPSAAWRSRTNRTARSRSSGLNFLGMFRFSFSWIGTKPRALQEWWNTRSVATSLTSSVAWRAIVLSGIWMPS